MSRKRSSAKASKVRRASKRARPRRRGRRRGERSGVIRAVGRRTAIHLSSRAAEVVGVGLLVLAALSVLGLWLRAGGPFGRVLTIAVRGVVGPVGYVLPVLAAYWALLLIRGTAEQDRGRRLVGLVLGSFGVLGIASVAEGNPSPGAGYHAVGGAGGLAGATVAWPLSRVVSPTERSSCAWG